MHGDDLSTSAEASAPLRDVVLAEFNRMAGFPTIVSRIEGDAKRRGLMLALSDQFPDIPLKGTTDRQLSSYLTYCRLKLDALPDPARSEAFFVATAVSYIGGRPEASVLRQDSIAPESSSGNASDPAPDRIGGAADAHNDEPERAVHRQSRTQSEDDKERHKDESRVQSRDVPMFPQTRGKQGLPASYAKFLLPCPDPLDGLSRARWLSGEVSSADGVAISFHLSGMRDEDLLMETEAEMSGDPSAFLRRHDASSMHAENVMPGVGEILNDLSRRLDPAGVDDTLEQMRDGLVRALGVFRPHALPELEAHGASLVVGSKALHAAALVQSAENVLLGDTDPQEERLKPPQRLMGNPHPDAALTPGTAMAGAFAKHLATGRMLLDALVDSLAELRLAQILRQTDERNMGHVMATFDAVFRADCLAPLDRYTVAKMEDCPQPVFG